MLKRTLIIAALALSVSSYAQCKNSGCSSAKPKAKQTCQKEQVCKKGECKKECEEKQACTKAKKRECAKKKSCSNK